MEIIYLFLTLFFILGESRLLTDASVSLLPQSIIFGWMIFILKMMMVARCFETFVAKCFAPKISDNFNYQLVPDAIAPIDDGRII